MLNQNLVTVEEYTQAKNQEVEFFFRTYRTGIQAPHFVFYIIEELEKKYGKEALRSEGMKVITSLDFELQEKIQEIVWNNILENEEEYGVENASVVAIESEFGKF